MKSKHSDLPTMVLEEFTYKQSPTEIDILLPNFSQLIFKPHIAATNTRHFNSALWVSGSAQDSSMQMMSHLVLNNPIPQKLSYGSPQNQSPAVTYYDFVSKF